MEIPILQKQYHTNSSYSIISKILFYSFSKCAFCSYIRLFIFRTFIVDRKVVLNVGRCDGNDVFLTDRDFCGFSSFIFLRMHPVMSMHIKVIYRVVM